MTGTPRLRWGAVALAALLLAAGALPALRLLLRHWESNPILRGRQTAAAAGCFNCHWPLGAAEIPNRGSRWGSVPRFAAGNAMMYAESCEEIGEFIRLGAPRSWLDDPAVAARLDGQQLRMPAFGTRLSEPELADLTSFACATEGLGLGGDETARAGRTLFRRHGCVGCHGVEASGGLPNPRSLGGFVPGFRGRNFSDLVRDEAEFREWVATGSSRRLEAHPVARFFSRRQAIQMPAYREQLSDEEIGQIWHWVESELRR